MVTIKPGKVAWDWWNANNIFGVDFKSGVNTATYKYYIDFASRYGIDDIILEPEFLDDYLEAFEGLVVYFVGVRCPLDVIGERERSRPGRFPGTARGHHEVCHAHGIYDVEVDTSVALPDECARQVYEVIANSSPDAFARLNAARNKRSG